jgi:hypothetical protein
LKGRESEAGRARRAEARADAIRVDDVHPHPWKIIQVADQGRAIEQRAIGRAAGASG